MLIQLNPIVLKCECSLEKIKFEQLCGHFNPNPYDCKNKVKAEVRKQLDFFMFFAQGEKPQSVKDGGDTLEKG